MAFRQASLRITVSSPASCSSRFVNARGFASAKTFKVSGDSVTVSLDNAFKTHKIDSPPTKAVATKAELLKYFTDMTTIRRLEVASDNMYKAKKIRGFLHLYNGQEAITSGMEAAITPDDHIITAYRDHGTMYGRGGTIEEILAELQGKVTGCSRGKGGSMHMYYKARNFHGGNGIVGAQCPIGAGVAFGLKYQGKRNVCIAMYGDGAANQGQLFEAFNMATLWKLPVLFVCENNKYGMGTSSERSSASTDYYTRGDFVPGIKVDAMSVLAVREAVKHAAEHAKNGNGPVVLELETYRYMGHSMSDPGLSYRTRDEVNEVRAQRDPITRLRVLITDSGLASEEELKKIEAEVKAKVDAAVAAADAAPFPPPADLYTDVYTDRPYFARAVDLADSVVVK